jgi:DHA2 family multidrug resistance protein
MHHAHLTEAIHGGSLSASRVLDSLQSSGLGATQALANVDRIIEAQAYVLSADDVFYAGAVIFICLIPLLWIASPQRGAAKPAEAGGAH